MGPAVSSALSFSFHGVPLLSMCIDGTRPHASSCNDYQHADTFSMCRFLTQWCDEEVITGESSLLQAGSAEAWAVNRVWILKIFTMSDESFGMRQGSSSSLWVRAFPQEKITSLFLQTLSNLFVWIRGIGYKDYGSKFMLNNIKQ